MSYLNMAFGWVIRMCAKFVDFIGIEHGYALTILLFSVVCQLILFPFAIKQQKNSQKQSRLRPKENVIRRRYNGRTDRNSQMKMNEEIQTLYQEEHYSPFSGCLPLLIQLPIILVLFNVVRAPLTYIVNMSNTDLLAIYNKLVELGAEGFDTVAESVKNINEINVLNCLNNNTAGIKDALSDVIGKYSIPSFQFWKIDLSVAPSAFPKSASWHIILIPVATFLSAFFGQKLTRKFSYQPPSAESPSSMKLMNVMMPLLSAYFAYTWQAVMGLYWTYRSILSLLQQIILSRMYPIYNYTEEELRAEEKAYLAKLKGKGMHKSVPANIPGRKSLIFDDEDDAAPVSKPKNSIIDDDAEDVSESKGSSLIDKAPLKDDDK